MSRDAAPTGLARARLALAATVALVLGGVWWLYAGLLSSSYDSACADSTAAEIAFAASYGGVGLAIAALVAAAAGALRPGWILLGVYAVLFAAAVAIGSAC